MDPTQNNPTMMTDPPAGEPTPPAAGDPTPPAAGDPPQGDPAPAQDPNRAAEGQQTPPTGDPGGNGGDPQPPQSFLESLPESLRGHERLSGIESVEDLAQRYTDAELAQPVPGADEYQLPEGLPKELGAVANKLGLSQEQLSGTLQAVAGINQAQAQAVQNHLAQAAQQKVESWGDEAKTKLAQGKQAVTYYGEKLGIDLVQKLRASGLGNDPDVMELFSMLGADLREGGFIPSNPNTPAGQRSAAATLYPNLASKEN